MTLGAFKDWTKKATSVHRTWCFTINNWTEEEYKSLLAFDVTRRAVGREHDVGSGTPHLQGFISFPKGYRLSGLKKLSPRAHWEVCVSPPHAWNYCVKEGSFHITDNRNQGKRTDIAGYRDAIKEGRDDKWLADHFPGLFLRFTRTNAMRAAYLVPRDKMTKCIMYYGPTKTGKSTLVKKKYPDADWLDYDGRFFSQYRNKEVVIFDDCDLGKFSPELIKRLINHVPMKIRVLGSYQEFNPKLIVFTTNYLPKWLSDEACKRRIEIIETEFDPDYKNRNHDILKMMVD